MKQTLGQAITIPAGLSVKLTGEQAKVRSHLLGSSKAGTYKLKEELQFKAGEEIEIVGKIPKGILPAFLLDKSEDGEVTVQQVANAITALNGETKVADLSRHLNAKVTAALRDEAVELLKQQKLFRRCRIWMKKMKRCGWRTNQTATSSQKQSANLLPMKSMMKPILSFLKVKLNR